MRGGNVNLVCPACFGSVNERPLTLAGIRFTLRRSRYAPIAFLPSIREGRIL